MLGDAEILANQFTFHYVSIKSFRHLKYADRVANLHSTMYLLNPAYDAF